MPNCGIPNAIALGGTVPLSIPELSLCGPAKILHLSACPPIADGDGAVVIGRFISQGRLDLVDVTLAPFDADGAPETVRGTASHPIWNETEADWVGLGDLQPGDLVRGRDSLLTVESVELVSEPQRVYNLEIHGEHVYEVTRLGLLTHNTGLNCNQTLVQLEVPEPRASQTYRDPNGRLRNANGTFAPDGGPKTKSGGTHGNTAGNQPATLYERYDKDGNFLKHGVSQTPSKRYTKKELDGGFLVEKQTGPRREILDIERDLVERIPGPLNNEPWAGIRVGE